MKNKIWMTVLALFCLGVGLLSGGCAAPHGSQRDELRPVVGGGSPGIRGKDRSLATSQGVALRFSNTKEATLWNLAK